MPGQPIAYVQKKEDNYVSMICPSQPHKMTLSQVVSKGWADRTRVTMQGKDCIVELWGSQLDSAVFYIKQRLANT